MATVCRPLFQKHHHNPQLCSGWVGRTGAHSATQPFQTRWRWGRKSLIGLPELSHVLQLSVPRILDSGNRMPSPLSKDKNFVLCVSETLRQASQRRSKTAVRLWAPIPALNLSVTKALWRQVSAHFTSGGLVFPSSPLPLAPSPLLAPYYKRLVLAFACNSQNPDSSPCAHPPTQLGSSSGFGQLVRSTYSRLSARVGCACSVVALEFSMFKGVNFLPETLCDKSQ